MISAIILAGGKGKRMNSKVSKQFIEIKDKPVIYYTIKKINENICFKARHSITIQ